MAAEHDRLIALRLRNHRAFGAEAQGITSVAPINVLVGRNNAGKSSLLDALAFLCGDASALASAGKAIPTVVVETRLTSADLTRTFRSGTSGGPIHGAHDRFAKQWDEGYIEWALSADGSRKLLSLFPSLDEANSVANRAGVEKLFADVVQKMDPPFKGSALLRVASDRDVRPEPDGEPNIAPDGRGATTAVRMFLHEARLDRDLVRVAMLKDLNEVFRPDASFTEISARHEDGLWEIYLGNEDEALVPLSASGSGLRTVLLVLAQLHLTPVVSGKALSQFVFAFEELENNMHPALQRRLMAYIRRQVDETGVMAFITTHSDAVIDYFAGDPSTSITHIQRLDSQSVAQPVTEYGHRIAILDDLDVRASDLLQSNGVIWVEGPSDRFYLNRWIELVSGGELREGAHYQCAFYGGRLLAHLSASPPDDTDLVHILNINRNCFVVIDSDRARPNDPINPTKERLLAEVEAVKGGAWVTHGREIENYLPPGPLGRLLGKTEAPRAVGRFDRFNLYLNRVSEEEARRFQHSKATFAARLTEHIRKEDLQRYDLGARLSELTAAIRSWNRLSE